MDYCNENQLLTVIVPISRMFGKMQNLMSWLISVDDHECEVIIVHDKQDEGTSEELKQLLQKLDSQKVEFLEGSFGSPGLARNFGKSHATGTHVMFCDSDDVLQLSSVLEVIEKNPNNSVIIGSYTAVNSLSSQKFIIHPVPENLFQLAKSPGMWRFIFRSEVVKNIDFAEFCMGEDQLFLAQVGMFSQDIVRVSETLYHYYTNNSSQLTSQKDRIPDLISVIHCLKEEEGRFDGKNRAFVKLLVLKNSLTILKNLRSLRVDSKKIASRDMYRQIIKIIFTLNWKEAFGFDGEFK